MKIFHPKYGNIEIPDNAEELRQNTQVARQMIEEEYSPVVMAYLDSCESAMDILGRERSEL